MRDIQNQPDFRKINIKKVGVKNISYPITVLDKANATQKTIATVNMYVNLPHQFKGTHMSRFVEILNRFHGEINLKNFHNILGEMKSRLQAQAAHMEIEFPYFLKKSDTAAGAAAVEYRCRMHGSLQDEDDLVMEIMVPIRPPSSAPASGVMPRSLGNWGIAKVALRFLRFIWIEDLIIMIESVASHNLSWSSPNPPGSHDELTLENMTRSLARKLRDNKDICWFNVNIKNFSQSGDTFAALEWQKA
ncbi:MAG: GTP cyclohydrolase I FolE2 [Deltaproteobacteria bacterium]|nr:GTP cyclohydrolase I FolE2 [Deltaproteobacteria bacterium]